MSNPFGHVTTPRKRLNHWPIVIGQEVGKIQNNGKAIGVEYFRPAASQIANTDRGALHGSGSILSP